VALPPCCPTECSPSRTRPRSRRGSPVGCSSGCVHPRSGPEIRARPGSNHVRTDVIKKVRPPPRRTRRAERPRPARQARRPCAARRTRLPSPPSLSAAQEKVAAFLRGRVQRSDRDWEDQAAALDGASLDWVRCSASTLGCRRPELRLPTAGQQPDRGPPARHRGPVACPAMSPCSARPSRSRSGRTVRGAGAGVGAAGAAPRYDAAFVAGAGDATLPQEDWRCCPLGRRSVPSRS
jgi:hypothetical protein